MARRTTLADMIAQLRAEVRDAPNAAFGLNVRESYAALLRRHQKVLWEQYDWPHMKIYGDKALAAGQRYYDPPTGMPVERITRIWHKWGSQWVPLRRGVSRALYGVYDSDNSAARSDPARKWGFYNGTTSDQIEIWPIPATNGDATTLQGYIRCEGTKALSAFVADADRADLDDTMIVTFAAAELLAARGAADAEAKANFARAQFNRLKANSKNSQDTVVRGAGAEDPGMHHGTPARWVYDDNGVPKMMRS